CMQDTQLWTF
nr:immunoglobulin light chain junction region [Macaca mulatta]MOW55234.1 immunoglobulin light chain junction region [Macaca mulatta]